MYKKKILTNNFSWSVTRDSLFRNCLRAYYYRYYASWGGWEDNAPEAARHLYLLNKMQTIAMWAGTVVHDTLKKAFEAFAKNESPFPTAETLKAAAIQRMRDDWRAAVAQKYLQKPSAFANLFELYYGNKKTLPKETTDAVKALILDCLDNAAASPALRFIRDIPPAQWKPIDNRDTFCLDGHTVYAAPDFACVDTEGIFHILDWKTGTEHREAVNLQLACYTLYAMEKWHLDDIGRIKLSGVFLRDGGRVSNYPVSAENLRSAKEVMLASIRKMKSKLVNPDTNTAEEKDFPCEPSEFACRSCFYREVCPAVNGL